MTDLLLFFCYSVFPFIQSCFTPSSFLGLPQFGVIPFEIRTLKKGHTERGRTQRFYIAEIVRHREHRWCVEEQRIFASVINVWSISLQSNCLQGLLKCLLPKLLAIAISNTYNSNVICALYKS